jgi:putative DNA primase/helicase
VMADVPVAASIPQVMRDNPAWVVWQYEPAPTPDDPEHMTKVPYSAHNGRNASSTDPATWATFKKALLYHVDHDWTDGIGMVVCDADNFVGIDLDNCRNAKTGEIEPWAQKVVDTVNSYTEITPSNEGLRIFARGTLPPTGRKRGDFEIYESGRYLTVTGRHLDGTPMTVEPRELEIRRVSRRPRSAPSRSPWTPPTRICSAWLKRPRTARNSRSSGAAGTQGIRHRARPTWRSA